MHLRLTCALETLQSGGEAFGSGEEVVLESGQPFALGHLHADLMLLLCEAGALAVQQELRKWNKGLVINETETSLACFLRFPPPHHKL